MNENIYENENVLRKEKRRKLHEMRKNGINPYPYKYDRTCSLEDIRKKFENIEPGEKKEDQIFKEEAKKNYEKLFKAVILTCLLVRVVPWTILQLCWI